MITLTVNPAWFTSPGEAFWFCRAFIGELVRELWRQNEGRWSETCWMLSRRYFCVFEPHKSGWPHFHLLLDARFVDIMLIEHVWNMLGQRGGKSGIGHVWYTKRRRHWTVEIAIAYVTKYLTKSPLGGRPVWVMESTRRIRRYTSSQGLNLLGLKKTKSKPAQSESRGVHGDTCFCRTCRGESEPARRCREETGLCHADRIKTCGAKTAIFVVGERMRPDGEIVERRRYIGTLACDIETTGRIFGIYVDWEKRIDLGDVSVDLVRSLCDDDRIKRLAAQRRLEKVRTRIRELRPRGQQSFVDVSPDRGAEALAL
jgi:hypothetical protein